MKILNLLLSATRFSIFFDGHGQSQINIQFIIYRPLTLHFSYFNL